VEVTSAPKLDDSKGWGGTLLVVAIIIGVLIWQPWSQQDDNTPTSSLPTSGFASGGSDGLGHTDSGTGTSSSILVVTDIYRATAGTGAEVCRDGRYDTNTYWSITVDDDTRLLCLTAYD
jgi:hypothetical protein